MVSDGSTRPVPRRSCLSTPGSSAAKLHKASTSHADEVVIDLEDSVAVSAKTDALITAIAALRTWPDHGPTVSVRVNAIGSEWCHVELVALAGTDGPLDTVIVPKVESAEDLAFLERLLDGAERASGRARKLGIQVLIESARGLSCVDEIAGASRRLRALILGYADLAADLGRPEGAATEFSHWHPAQERVLTAARAHSLQAIDGPWLGVADDAPFRQSATCARDLGFDGKWAIHPIQIEALNELFTPTAEALRQARAVIDALDRADAEAGAGAVKLDAWMLDEAVRRSALRVLARARPTL
jgi:citrate lyase subunit beta/citryl-CoA lyase